MAERRRQDRKWGEQNHDNFIWLSILTEEVGEFAQAANDLHFINTTTLEGFAEKQEHLREEAVQVAAVALAIVESIDRR